LLRVNGKRVLRLGTKDSVSMRGVSRVIAHTHTSPGVLNFSGGDLRALYYHTKSGVLKQRSTMIINTAGKSVRKSLPGFIKDTIKK
jgi:hypothetical protein